MRKIVIGLPMIGIGFSIIWINGAAIYAALFFANSGVSITSLCGVAIGVAALGMGAELFGMLRPEAEEKKSVVANSTWASRADIKEAGIDKNPKDDPSKEGIYLGLFEDAMGSTALYYRGGKHILSVGVPGANKSTGLVTPALSGLMRSMITVDLKQEEHAICARKRSQFGAVRTLAPFHDETENEELLGRFHWNPMRQIPDPTNHEFAPIALCIADAISDKGEGGGNSKFFENAGRDLAHLGIMWERYTYGEKASLRHVRAMIAEPNQYNEKKQLVGGFLHTLAQMAACEHFAIRTAAGRMLGRLTDPNSQATSAQDVIDTFMTSTRFLDDPRIGADMWQGEAINFADFHQNITTVFLCLPPHELIGQAKWLKLFINISLAELYRNPPKKPALPPVLYLLDEFGNWGGGMSEILTAMNLSRGYRAQLWLFIQSTAQLRAKYQDSWPAFYSGAGAITTFKTGDMESSELLAKFFGNKEQDVTTESLTGISDTPHAIPLIRPEDINRLRQGEMISQIEPCEMPIKGSAPVYVHTPFNEGLDPNPFYHG
jgi:type IV secretory pathway TraG/TraD family ATPase VirD4